MSAAARRRALEHGAALLAVLAPTGACAWAGDLFSTTDRALVYVLAVAAVASRVSRGPSLVHVLAGIAAFDFFFVEPRYTLNVADHAFLVTFAVMLAVGFTVSTMTVRIREQAHESAAARVVAETERTRSELLSAVSHDLRTPLASISGAAGELLERGDALGEAGRREMLETIREEGRRLGRLVDALLELTRIESGTFRPSREWCDLEEIVGSALERVEGRGGERPVAVRLPPEVVLVPGDPVLLEHVLVNLLENALKYSPAGSPVEIEARAEPGRVSVEVRDRGPGLAPGEAGRVFERYYRGSASRGTTGWGLGLAVCRAIVQVHGGAIRAAPREGGGAVFRFDLPRGEVPLPAPAAAGAAA